MFPLGASEYVGAILTPLILFLSQTGGLSGGGTLIPVMILFFGFDTKQAIALSNFSICLSSYARFFQHFNKSHPLKEGKGVLVDYSIASIMLPMIVLGATLGVMVNKVIPALFIALILFILLAIMSIMTTKKLRRIQREEREKFGPLCPAGFFCCCFNSKKRRRVAPAEV